MRFAFWTFNRGVNDRPLSVRQYDAITKDYPADNVDSAWNAYYERPAIISLLGNVENRDELEARYGSGLLTKWLVYTGAKVTAFDASAEMVGQSRSSAPAS